MNYNKPNKTDDEIHNIYNHPKMKKYLTKYPNPNFENNQMSTPFRTLIVSGSGGGKSTITCELMRKFPNTFSHVYVWNSGLEEPIYDLLKELFKSDITITANCMQLPSFDELETNFKKTQSQTLFIFDDLVKHKDQTYIEQMFLKGRKCGCSSVYLSQKYYTTPIFIRANLTYLFLLKIKGTKDLNMILRNHSLGVELPKLIQMYKESTAVKPNFLKIDLETSDPNKIFAKNFKTFFDIEPNQQIPEIIVEPIHSPSSKSKKNNIKQKYDFEKFFNLSATNV
jgi:hypothetical protein